MALCGTFRRKIQFFYIFFEKSLQLSKFVVSLQCQTKTQHTMVTKGTQNYKKAQEIANELSSYAKASKNFYNGYEMSVDKIAHFTMALRDAKVGFASQVAETIYNSCGTGFTAARISDKQAWICACAAVENNIEF